MKIMESLPGRLINTSTTHTLRENFILDPLFETNRFTSNYILIDRHVVGGIMPIDGGVCVPTALLKYLNTPHLLAAREIGFVNVGGPGLIETSYGSYRLEFEDALYIGRGCELLEFRSESQEKPAKFYYHCNPADRELLNIFVSRKLSPERLVRANDDGGRRTATQLITSETVETCRLSIGLLHAASGERWVTMPPHVHLTRSEVYTYYNLDPQERVFHFLGERDKTRHLVLQNEQAVFAPGHLLHFGVGTASYSVIWSISGENRLLYDDMERVPPSDIL